MTSHEISAKISIYFRIMMYDGILLASNTAPENLVYVKGTAL